MKPREFLRFVMEGNDVSEEALKEFIAQHPDEGEHHEFKDGKITYKNNIQKGRAKIRVGVSAFANSSGGVLIIGVADDKTISHCAKSIGGAPLEQWAYRLLTDMAPYLSPIPRIKAVTCSEGQVLIMACPRSSALVPCQSSERTPQYYLRMGDSSMPYPEYLISDIILGHRRQPVLDLILDSKKSKFDGSHARIVFLVENMSFIKAKEVRLGAAAYCGKGMNPKPVNKFLRMFIELSMPDGKLGLLNTRTSDAHWETPPLDILPFGTTTIHLMPFVPDDFGNSGNDICAAVFLTSDNGPTVWYQLTFNSDTAALWKLERIDYGRPYVGPNRIGGRSLS